MTLNWSVILIIVLVSDLLGFDWEFVAQLFGCWTGCVRMIVIAVVECDFRLRDGEECGEREKEIIVVLHQLYLATQNWVTIHRTRAYFSIATYIIEILKFYDLCKCNEIKIWGFFFGLSILLLMDIQYLILSGNIQNSKFWHQWNTWIGLH